MQHAKAQRTQIERVVREEGVTLTLSIPAAETLLAMTVPVSGDEERSPLKYVVEIFTALTDVLEVEVDRTQAFKHLRGFLEFLDYEEPQS